MLSTKATRTLSKVETESFYDRFGSKQDKQAFYEDPSLEELVSHSHFGTAKALVEFGCGTGRFAQELLVNHLPSDATYWGCDISSTMVELAASRLDEFGERALVVKTDGEPSIPLSESVADRFVSTYVLDILPEVEIEQVLREAGRVLHDDGLLCLTSITGGRTPLSKIAMTLWRFLYWLRPKWVGGCRPITLSTFLRDDQWDTLHRGWLTAYGVASEVVVARKKKVVCDSTEV